MVQKRVELAAKSIRFKFCDIEFAVSRPTAVKVFIQLGSAVLGILSVPAVFPLFDMFDVGLNQAQIHLVGTSIMLSSGDEPTFLLPGLSFVINEFTDGAVSHAGRGEYQSLPGPGPGKDAMLSVGPKQCVQKTAVEAIKIVSGY